MTRPDFYFWLHSYLSAINWFSIYRVELHVLSYICGRKKWKGSTFYSVTGKVQKFVKWNVYKITIHSRHNFCFWNYNYWNNIHVAGCLCHVCMEISKIVFAMGPHRPTLQFAIAHKKWFSKQFHTKRSTHKQNSAITTHNRIYKRANKSNVNANKNAISLQGLETRPTTHLTFTWCPLSFQGNVDVVIATMEACCNLLQTGLFRRFFSFFFFSRMKWCSWYILMTAKK